MVGAYLLGLFLVVGFAKADYLEPAYIPNIKGSIPDTRIVGGWEAEIGQIPHQVSIRMVATDGLVYACGGAIIHNNWVITAAHCTVNRITYVIRFGAVELIKPTYIIEETTENNFVHPRYSMGTNDIALIKLSRSIPYGPTIRPIRLQSSEQKDNDYTDVVLVVSGFGANQDSWNGGTASQILLWTLLRGISNDECGRLLIPIDSSYVCAQYYNDTIQSACSGDSGGPLTHIDADGERTMIGIVSFGSAHGCANFRPTAYVRPGYYHDWMYEITGINFDWSSSTKENLKV